MNVRDVMTENPTWIKPEATLQEAAQKMEQLDTGSLLIGENEKLTGFITDHDIIVRGVAQGRNPTQTAVSECCTSKVLYCFDNDNVNDAAANMEQNNVLRLVVLDQNKQLKGIISQGDIARAIADQSADDLEGRVNSLAAVRNHHAA